MTDLPHTGQGSRSAVPAFNDAAFFVRFFLVFDFTAPIAEVGTESITTELEDDGFCPFPTALGRRNDDSVIELSCAVVEICPAVVDVEVCKAGWVDAGRTQLILRTVVLSDPWYRTGLSREWTCIR